MAAPEKILELVERFDANLSAYKKGQYNETQLRREFIDPFFKELGWDVDNEQGFSEAYKDVVHEDAIKIGSATKAPDYCFRIGGTRKFFLEAKKPTVNIREEIHPAYQLRRYAWSARLPLSILTDFEEFAVYDCRIRPHKTDKASKARILYLTFREYPERWEDIYAIFSKEAVLKGAFDRYVETTQGKRGTAEVDSEFLKEIEHWRELLARNIALRNPKLNVRELNYAVQKIIDRIIFLRICEDRGIEVYGQLQSICAGPRIYPRLMEVFYSADEKYNSGLFHFRDEKGQSSHPDELTPDLIIDDKVLKTILSRLYYPDCPYEFSVMPVEILGNVYEQFLGKVIHLTAGHRARIEEKPEVRKAGGVYYTPKYIVDYIVKHTVGKLIEGKSPRQIEKLRIMDPACGSGSFLLGAYQYLLDYHRDYYQKEIEEKGYQKRHRKVVYQGRGGQWLLTTAEKKRILLNNIYGVDIDSQAVEVTKLSLLLKVLENESQDTLEKQLRLWRERALPDLGSNIKCGNSLIGSDFYQYQQLNLFDEEERLRINAFDWETEFPQIMQSGGFDVVIGNPPYVPIESMNDYEKKYYQGKHPELQRKYDSSIVFILSMIKKLKSNGLLGFISSVSWQTGENFSGLRKKLFESGSLLYLINLPFDVFKGAYVDTGIYIYSNKPFKGYYIYRFPKKAKIYKLDELRYTFVSRDLISPPEYKIVLCPQAESIFLRYLGNLKFKTLGEITISTQGLAKNRFKLKDRPQNENWYPFLEQGQVYRYQLNIDCIKYTDMSDKKSLMRFYKEGPKILIRRVINRQDRLMATFLMEKLVFKKDVNPFLLIELKLDAHYVLGIINSKLISYLYINTSSIATKDDFRQTTLAELRRIPIRVIDFSNPNDRILHNRMVQLVETMLDLHKRLQQARLPEEKTQLQRQIEATDRQIDQLVYELYELTEDEIKIVESEI